MLRSVQGSYLTCTSSDEMCGSPCTDTDHLNDSLRCWWHIGGGWVELAIIVIRVIAIQQWVQRNLLGMGSLAPDCSLHMRPQNVLLEGPMVGGSFSLSAMYLQNRCQRRSGMLEIWRPFGQYAVHTWPMLITGSPPSHPCHHKACTAP